jgi:uncharacterized membrane protein SirB2
MLYAITKSVHIVCVTLSISGFCLRWLLLMQKSALAGRLAGQRWFRILPHVNDSILLAAAIVLALSIGQYPFVDHWLTAKIFGLLVYIALGALTLKNARRNPRRAMLAGLAAVMVFGWIVSVALHKDPLGILAG